MDDDFGVYALKLPGGRPESTIADALIDYLTVRNEAFFTGEAPLDELARVSVGQPLTEVQGYVQDLVDAEQHTVGDFWVSVPGRDIGVDGDTAKLKDLCALNATANVNDDLVAQESPSDAYLVDATAVKAARDVWLISSLSFEAVSSC